MGLGTAHSPKGKTDNYQYSTGLMLRPQRAPRLKKQGLASGTLQKTVNRPPLIVG